MKKTKILLSLDEEALKMLDEKVNTLGLKRSIYVEQVLRKQLGLPSIFGENKNKTTRVR